MVDDPVSAVVGSCTDEKRCVTAGPALRALASGGRVVYECFGPYFDEVAVIVEELVEPLLLTVNKFRSSTCSSPRSGSTSSQLISGIGVRRRAGFRPLVGGANSSFGACGSVGRGW